MTRRWLASVALAGAVLVVSTPPAAAHAITGVASTNYESVLLGPTPLIPGVAVQLRDLGRRVEVRNTTTTDLVISGYSDEPYLRVGPAGVFENTRSPTVYQNLVTTPGATAVLPADASTAAAPNWRRISSHRVVRWRDQRTRHEGPTPEAVRRAPHSAHVISTWSILMSWGPTQVVANGLIRWAPAPSPWPWLIGAAVLAVGVYAGSRTDQWPLVVALATGAVVAVDVVHSLVAVIPSSDSLAQAAARFLGGGLVSVVGWAAGAAGAALLQQGNRDGLFLAAFAGIVLLLTGGVGDLTILGRSQIPYAVDPSLGRLLVSITIGLAAGAVAAAVDRLRRGSGSVGMGRAIGG